MKIKISNRFAKISNIIKFSKLYLNTIKFLTIKQVYYRLIYLYPRNLNFDLPKQFKVNRFEKKWEKPLYKNNSYLGNKSFIFLNHKQTIKKDKDWSLYSKSKLWVYNLNYFPILDP